MKPVFTKEGSVTAANASGKPTIGVGPGNAPVYVHESADIPMAVLDVLMSKTFDASTICPAEQTMIVDRTIDGQVRADPVGCARAALTALQQGSDGIVVVVGEKFQSLKKKQIESVVAEADATICRATGSE